MIKRIKVFLMNSYKDIILIFVPENKIYDNSNGLTLFWCVSLQRQNLKMSYILNFWSNDLIALHIKHSIWLRFSCNYQRNLPIKKKSCITETCCLWTRHRVWVKRCQLHLSALYQVWSFNIKGNSEDILSRI